MKTRTAPHLPRVTRLIPLVVAAWSLAAAPAWAATLNWTNTSGGDWNYAANWNPNAVPSASDTANITTPGTYTVTASAAGFGVATLNVGGAAGSGKQTFQVRGAATLGVSSGITVSPAGALAVLSGGGLSVLRNILLQGPLTNAGTINLTNDYLYIFNNGNTAYQGGLVNAAGGVINLYGNETIQTAGGYGPDDYFINQGSVNKLAGSPNSISVSVFSLAGTWNVAAGTTLQFSVGTVAQPMTEDPAVVLTGAGQYIFTGGVLLLTQTANTNLLLNGGTLELGPGFQQSGAITNLALGGITLAGTNTVAGTLWAANGSTVAGPLSVAGGGVFNHNGGNLSVSSVGSVTVRTGGVLNSLGYIYLSGPLTNAGTINLTNDYFYIFNNGNTAYQGGLVNAAGGVINLYGNETIQTANGYGPDDYFINQGSVNKLAGSPNTINVSSLFLGGTWNAAAGTTLQFSGGTVAQPMTEDPAVVLTGAGQCVFTGGVLLLTQNSNPNLLLNGGTLELGPGFQQGGAITNLTLNGITLTGSNTVTGTLRAANGSTVAGPLLVANGGFFYNMGGRLNVSPTGSVTVATGGVLSALGNIYLSGPLTNGGIINVTNDYIYIYNNGTSAYQGGLVNAAGGLINLYGNESIQTAGSFGPDDYFFNRGGVIKIAGSPNSISVSILSLGGTWNVAAGAAIQITGGSAAQPITEDPSLVVTGAGQCEFVSGVLLLTQSSSPNLLLNGGTLELGPGFQQGGAITNLALDGITLTGTNTVAGTLVAANGSTLGGPLVVASGGVFHNAGGQLWVSPTGSVTVATGGTLRAYP